MSFNGSGTFTRIYNWVTDKNQNINITASRMDDEDNNFASGLSNCITKDGQTILTQNIPFNSKKITGLANGVNIDDAINLGQLQNNQFLYLGTTGGSADFYTLSPNPSITSYATTQQFTIKINASNLTSYPSLQISGIADPSSTAVIKKLNASKTEVPLEAGDLLINGIYKFQRNSNNNAWIVLNPEKPFVNLANGTLATTTTAGIQTLIPIGSITMWSSTGGIPANHLKCEGAAISRTTYGNLFSVIGTIWGAGDGSTTFNVPDFRGVFPRGFDNGRGIDSGRNFGSFQDHSIQSHNHFISVQNETIAGGGSTIPCNRPGGIQINTNSVGGTETRPRNLAVYFLIKFV